MQFFKMYTLFFTFHKPTICEFQIMLNLNVFKGSYSCNTIRWLAEVGDVNKFNTCFLLLFPVVVIGGIGQRCYCFFFFFFNAIDYRETE